MLDSQFPSAVATVLEDGLSKVGSPEEIEAASEPTNLKQLDDFTLSHIVVKLADAAQLLGTDATGSGAVPSTQVLETTQRLVELIGQLRSSNSGWPADIPQTPDTLLPYVLEEACEVQEALQKTPFLVSLKGEDGTVLSAEQGVPAYWVVSELGAWLLWAIARSDYDVMRLLEGTSARIFQPDQGWQTGNLRLVAFLQINWVEQFGRKLIQLDLTTHQPVKPLLPSNAMVQAVDNDMCREPIWVEGLLQGLLQHIQTITPALTPIIQGVSVETLVPHQAWERGSIQLQVGLEFVANDTPSVGLAPHIDSTAELSSETVDVEITRESTVNPILRFTDLNWIEQYASTITRQQILSFMSYVFTSRGLEATAIASNSDVDQLIDPTHDALVQMVQDACKTADFLQTAPVLASRSFPQHSWSLNDVSLRLLWSISRSAYAVMPLLAGIQSDVLEPGTNWQNGLLRLVVCLHVQTPESDWWLDLVTGDLESVTHDSLAADAVVQLHQAGRQQQPMMLKDLRDRTVQQIQQTTPELQLFFSGTCIDVLDDNQHWQPGTLYLSTNFQFVPKRVQ
jgi:hypothetical protein